MRMERCVLTLSQKCAQKAGLNPVIAVGEAGGEWTERGKRANAWQQDARMQGGSWTVGAVAGGEVLRFQWEFPVSQPMKAGIV
eukprot:307829-Rhodomonas_salina.2